MKMKKKENITRISIMCIFVITTLLTGCGSSDEKIIEAQSKYRELINTYNQVVKAHDAIEDVSLDDELKALSVNIEEIKSYNLADMTDEEIDMLIESINTLNDSYSGYLKAIGEIKENEDASVLKPVSFSLVNETNMVFTALSLMEEGEKDLVTDVLEPFEGFMPKQEIMGLTLYFDVDNTPWILSIRDSEDNVYDLKIDSGMLSGGKSKRLVLENDEETGVLHFLG